MKKSSLFLFIFISFNCLAQFSKTHYIAPMSGSSIVVAQEQYLYISTPSVTAIKVNINAIGSGTTTVSVSQNSPYVYFIGSGNDTQLMSSSNFLNTALSNKGFIIEAESLIYVAARVNAGVYNQAGSLVSKGLSALGKEFRVGAFINTGTQGISLGRYTFLSILATENNTLIEFSDIKPGVTLINNPTAGNTPASIILNKGESYLMATEDIRIENKDGLIGALVKADKPITFNCGSFAGTNGNLNNLDLGFDQIVPIENIKNKNTSETKYIFVRGSLIDVIERPLLVAHEDNTEIFINEVSTKTLNAGQYLAIDGSLYGPNGNMYVRTTKPAFAFQSVGGSSQANQEMFFVPPLNCSTPNIVNNIPFIEQIGTRSFNTNSGLNIVTETAARIQIGINGVNYPITGLPSGIIVNRNSVIANADFEVYRVTGLRGNIGVFSDKQIYVSYFGSNSAATYGGYYSGFDLKPEISSELNIGAINTCIPNVILKISNLANYDSFEWYKNDVLISGEITNSYTPTEPGFYQVRASISGCTTAVFSDKIPVSQCPTNLDNDLANDNIDIDNDNDGILNCTESYGNQNINILNFNAGSITTGNYANNSFTGTVSTSTAASAIPFVGNSNGSFISEIPKGKNSSLSYKMSFARPISVGIEYVSTANASDLINDNAEYIVNSDPDKTITVLNPNNQLLIDVNFDGIYETGITEFSSFEIRFRLNSATALPAGSGTFKFLSYLANSIKITHKNLSDTAANKATFKLFASCIPNDSDGDNIPDQIDTDSDDDGILDSKEAQVNATKLISNADTNKDGLDNAFEPGFTPFDFDNDGVPDYLDFDSDNDGILDSVETGVDLDADGIGNYRDLDSDNDLCFDVTEAGFIDGDKDGKFGNSPTTPGANGRVAGASYAVPNPNYLISAPIIIITQPTIAPTCELQNATISLVDNGGNTYQWQLSTNGINWNNLNNNGTYGGVSTNTLTITALSNAMNGYKYRVQLNKTGNSCGLTSAEATLTVYLIPVINDITIVQCDIDLDAIATFNLTVKNLEISTNFANETLTYYLSLAGANTADTTQLIPNPLAFTNTTAGTMPVWARVQNANGCFSVSRITLQVLATNIPFAYKIRLDPLCDDFLDTNGNNNATNNKRDGITTFNLTATKATIQDLLPTTVGINYTITYYRNKADADAELNPIIDISNYLNIGYPNSQDIWVRVDSDVDNACYGLGPFVSLTVEKLPFANQVSIPRKCDDNQDGIFTFDTTSLESTLLGTNQSFGVTVTYLDATNNPLKDANGVLITSPFPATFTTKSQIITAVVTNNTTQQCFDETTIQFIVDYLPQAFAIPVLLTSICDDEKDPLLQNGKLAFDTATFETTILNGQTGMNVKYFDGTGNPLPRPLPNPFVTATQNVKVIVENPMNKTCPATITIPFVVNPPPKINLNTNGKEDLLVCQNSPAFSLQLDAGIQDGSLPSNYTYAWSKDGNDLPAEKGYTISVTAIGLYQVVVKSNSGCPMTRTIKVTLSDTAEISNIKIVDMADVNSVTVNLKTGFGDYEFSLDQPFGPYQKSNFFDNVSAGIHDIYIKDKNGCEPVKVTISVVGVPKFFTPNNDGYNDYWGVKGVNASFNSNSTIYIFNRFGKLLKQWVPASGNDWDGTVNGNPLPADDYWYTIKLEDGREAKGHFSLKR